MLETIACLTLFFGTHMDVTLRVCVPSKLKACENFFEMVCFAFVVGLGCSFGLKPTVQNEL